MSEEKPETQAESEPSPVEKPRKPEAGWQEDLEQESSDEENSEVRGTDESAYAPIADHRHFGRLEFVRRRLPAKPWVARVFVKATGELVGFDRDKQPTTGELVWSGFRSVYEVDLSLRRLTLDITLPSVGDAFVFRAEVDLQWRVEKPELVVRRGITDIRKVVVPLLLDRLRRETRFRRTDEVEAAEIAANGLFGHSWLTEEYGLWTQVLVRLRMDKQKEHNVRLKSEVEMFKTLIKGGDLDQFALQLAQNPHEVGPVVQALFKERDSHRREVFSFITRLIESDALDRWQIDDQVRVTLQWLQASIHRVLSGTDDARQLSFDGAAKPASNGAGS